MVMCTKLRPLTRMWVPSGRFCSHYAEKRILFKGSVLNPETGKAMPFQGILFKKGNVGMGYFLSSGQSGEAYLCPAP